MRDGFVCPVVHPGISNLSQEMAMKIPPIVQGNLHEIASAIANLLQRWPPFQRSSVVRDRRRFPLSAVLPIPGVPRSPSILKTSISFTVECSQFVARSKNKDGGEPTKNKITLRSVLGFRPHSFTGRLRGFTSANKRATADLTGSNCQARVLLPFVSRSGGSVLARENHDDSHGTARRKSLPGRE
jgi:hypothetical protein